MRIRAIRLVANQRGICLIQKALEYLEGGNEVIPMSSPLQGMKAQSLQSLFIGQVTHAS